MLNFLRERIWAHVPSTATRKQLVQAALLWGVVLPLVIAVVHWLRHRNDAEPGIAPLVIMGVGVTFGLCLLVPVLGEKIYVGVLRVFAIVGFVVSNIVLTLVFYLMVTPIGVVLRATGKVASAKKPNKPQWVPHKVRSDLRQYYRRF